MHCVKLWDHQARCIHHSSTASQERVLNWPASQQSRPFTDRKHLVHHKMKNPSTKAQKCWSAGIRQEWDDIPHLKLQQLVSSLPRCLQTAVKRGGDVTQWLHLPVPTSLRCVAVIKVKLFHEMVKCLSFNIWYVFHVLLGIKYGLANHYILFL